MPFFQLTRTGLSYAARILIGCLITWWTLAYFDEEHKVWALISVIVVTDTDRTLLREAILSRIINTVVGCAIGLLLIYLFGAHAWVLMIGVTAAVLTSTSLRNYPSSWKLAPVTVVIIILPSMLQHTSWKGSMEIALYRTGEVLYGSLVAFLLSIIFPWTRKFFFRDEVPAKPATAPGKK
jgi:uncharacterized membrane protein YccC